MALRKILTEEDETLHVVCKPVEKFDERLGIILDDMKETLTTAQGVGLAGPQIGLRRRIVVIDSGEEIIELINPVILKKSGKDRDVEGCLSCPSKWGYVTRPTKCKVRAQDRNGEFFEMMFYDLGARCACHELDHLEGRLFTELVDEFVTPEEVK